MHYTEDMSVCFRWSKYHGNYFLQDYLRKNKDEFLENENYKSVTIIILFPF